MFACSGFCFLLFFVLLLPKNGLFTTICASLDSFESGLKLTREQPEQQDRVEIAP